MTGTPNQIEWAEQIRPRVEAEFARVARAFREVAARQDPESARDTLELAAIVEEKGRSEMEKNSAGYFIQEWQELGSQVRRMLAADPRFALIRSRRASRAV